MSRRISVLISVFMAAAVLLALGDAPARADVTSGFAAANDGWAVVDYPFHASATGPRATAALAFDGGNGLPPGSVRVGDVFAETGIAAPAGFLGDRQSYYGGSLAYDILLRYSDGVAYPAVVLAGTSQSVYYDAPSPAIGDWASLVVPLTETGWRIGGTMAPASQAQFLAVLQSLEGLYIYTEWHTGTDDTNVDNIVLRGSASGVDLAPAPALAVSASPNPFNPRTTIRFELDRPGRANLAIHDLSGRLVRTLLAADLPAGSQAVTWDGLDGAGRSVGSGRYLARLECGGRAASTGLVLVR